MNLGPKDIQILIAMAVGILSIVGSIILCAKTIGKLIVKVNSASEKVDALKSALYTDGKIKFVEIPDCMRHRAEFEKMINSAIETATLRMTRTIEQDFQATIEKLHDRLLRDRK